MNFVGYCNHDSFSFVVSIVSRRRSNFDQYLIRHDGDANFRELLSTQIIRVEESRIKAMWTEWYQVRRKCLKCNCLLRRLMPAFFGLDRML